MRRFFARFALFVAAVPGAVRRALPAFAAVVFAASLIAGIAALAGCSSVEVHPRAVIPATLSDTDTLRADHDMAIGQARADANAAVEALRAEKNTDLATLRTDIETIKGAGQRAYDAAVKAGMSQQDALGLRFEAERVEAQNRLDAAIAKAKKDTDDALAVAKSKADTAAKTADEAGKKAGDAPSLLLWIAGLLGTTGVGGAIAKLLLIAHDAAPFVDANGNEASESQLVAAARALGAAVAAPKAPAGPTS